MTTVSCDTVVVICEQLHSNHNPLVLRGGYQINECSTVGSEPNTPLGQAYRNPNMQIVSAQAVYENDEFVYELGLNPRLIHKPALKECGDLKLF